MGKLLKGVINDFLVLVLFAFAGLGFFFASVLIGNNIFYSIFLGCLLSGAMARYLGFNRYCEEKKSKPQGKKTK